MPWLLKHLQFDAIIYHYTFLSQKWNGREYFKKIQKKISFLKTKKSYSVALPQDEYIHSDLICEFISDFNVNLLGTCYYEIDWSKAYPRNEIGSTELLTVLTGYLDHEALVKISPYVKPHSERSHDIGYRARKLPFWLGQHSLKKWMVTNVFLNKTKDTKFKVDLSNSEKDVFFGDAWYEFLCNCRVVLGCEGGASLLDVDGEIRRKVDEYVYANPQSEFAEVEESCFKGLDNNISLFAISPRHFEACISKTCQVLIEGHYHGIFIPNVHYIELKKDFSNIEEVLEKIKDHQLCQTIAEASYKQIALNPEYTYQAFVDLMLIKIRNNLPRDLKQLNFGFSYELLNIILKFNQWKYRLLSWLGPNIKKIVISFLKTIGLYYTVRLLWRFFYKRLHSL